MKVTLTKPELLNIIAKYLRVKVEDFELVAEPTPLPEIVPTLREAVESVSYRGTAKIQAIKNLRMVASQFMPNKGEQFGLADAKWAVENWEKFIAFVVENNRLPLSGMSWNCNLR